MKIKQTGYRNWMSAITFAEAGEWETAREMTPAIQVNKKISWISKIFMAVTFAENDMRDEALRCLEATSVSSQQYDDFMNTVGLAGIRMTYGILAVDSNR